MSNKNEPFEGKELGEIPAINQLGVLFIQLFEFLKAGGLAEKEAERIWYLFMDCVYEMPVHTHGMLVDQIIEKWAMNIIKMKENAYIDPIITIRRNL